MDGKSHSTASSLRQYKNYNKKVTPLKSFIDKIKALADYLFEKYEWALSFLLRIHKVKVDKERYIRRTVKRFYKGEEAENMALQALETSLCDVLTEKQQRKVYRRMMWKYGFIVFLVSFALTLTPEDWWIVAIACVLDLFLFQCFLFIAMQKIMLLYGDNCDLKNDETKSIERIIAIDSSGLMIGKYPLLQKMKSVVGWLGKQIVKKLGPTMVSKVTRPIFLVVRRQAIKWCSFVVSKEHVSMALDALIPITCAIISGLVSVVIFIPMCNKLRKHLVQNVDIASENIASQIA